MLRIFVHIEKEVFKSAFCICFFFLKSITWVFKDLLVAWRWAVLVKERVERLTQAVNTFCFILPTAEFSLWALDYSYTAFPDWHWFKWVLLFLLCFIETVSCCVVKTYFHLISYPPVSGIVFMWQHTWVIILCLYASVEANLWFSLVLIMLFIHLTLIAVSVFYG